jgi:ubiquinone/menaquinone biosynthesis C-methylase UbiE
VRTHAPGRTFLDVGCMWGIDGAISFLAETAGATAVTGIDVIPPTAGFEAERSRRGSAVRFVHADLHDAATPETVGVHDVVWCSGVIYHAPHPLTTLERLRALTGELLILSSETIPELPGVPQACVFYPGLSPKARRAFADPRTGRRAGLDTAYDPDAGYENWFWGLTPSALEAMVEASGFEVIDRVRQPLHQALVARVL